jgi:hypothetical protein
MAHPGSQKPQSDFSLPQDIPLHAWAEFPGNYPAPVSLPMLEQSFSKQGYQTEVVSMSGVELFEAVTYDPTSNLLGIWFDKNGWLRGVCRIKIISPE